MPARSNDASSWAAPSTRYKPDIAQTPVVAQRPSRSLVAARSSRANSVPFGRSARCGHPLSRRDVRLTAMAAPPRPSRPTLRRRCAGSIDLRHVGRGATVRSRRSRATTRSPAVARRPLQARSSGARRSPGRRRLNDRDLSQAGRKRSRTRLPPDHHVPVAPVSSGRNRRARRSEGTARARCPRHTAGTRGQGTAGERCSGRPGGAGSGRSP